MQTDLDVERRMLITEPRMSRWVCREHGICIATTERQDDVGTGRKEIECLAGTGEVIFGSEVLSDANWNWNWAWDGGVRNSGE
jgi:hypothetical protein